MEKIGVDVIEYWSMWISNQITTEAFSFILVTAITILSKKSN